MLDGRRPSASSSSMPSPRATCGLPGESTSPAGGWTTTKGSNAREAPGASGPLVFPNSGRRSPGPDQLAEMLDEGAIAVVGDGDQQALPITSLRQLEQHPVPGNVLLEVAVHALAQAKVHGHAEAELEGQRPIGLHQPSVAGEAAHRRVEGDVLLQQPIPIPLDRGAMDAAERLAQRLQ